MEIFRKLFSIAKIILAFNLANDQFFQNVGFLIDIKNHQLLNLIPDQKQYLNDEIELLKNSTKVLLLENLLVQILSLQKMAQQLENKNDGFFTRENFG